MSVPNFVTVEDVSSYIPEEHKETLCGADWGDVHFTTFSICETAMEDYEITDDGRIYKRNEEGILELEYTGEIEFGTVLTLEKNDYEVTFKALFFKGDLKELQFENLEEMDRSTREKAQEKIMEVIKTRDALSKKWWYPIYLFYVKVVIFLFTCIRWFLGLFIKLCWMIQNRIT